jgi:hypothetical protein
VSRPGGLVPVDDASLLVWKRRVGDPIIERSGHMTFVEEPLAYMGAVATFFRKPMGA